MHPFRQAVEAADHEAVEALLADDVVFTSPVVFKPYEGKPVTALILRSVSQVFGDFRYEQEITDGADTVLVFRATVGDREVQGVDLLHTREDGLVDALTVMVRPLSAAQALQRLMGEQLARATAP